MRTLRRFLTGFRWFSIWLVLTAVIFSIWLVLTAVIAVPTTMFAMHLVLQQPDSPAAALPGPTSPPDWQLQVSLAITSLGALAVPFITYWVRVWLGKLPRIALPAVAILVGLTIAQLSNVVITNPYPLLTGAAMGVLGTWLREIHSTVKQHQLRS